MRIGAHVDPTDPLDAARDRGADAVQFFLTDPQGYKSPKPREDAAALRESGVDIYIHAPYIVNVATLSDGSRWSSPPERTTMTPRTESSAPELATPALSQRSNARWIV